MANSKCDTCSESTKCPTGFWDGYDDTTGKATHGLTFDCDSLSCEVAELRRAKAEYEIARQEHAKAKNATNGVDIMKLRKARQAAYCTIKEAAECLGCSAAQYSAYEMERMPMPKERYITLYKYLKENAI